MRDLFSKLSWDDLRVILAIGRTGGLARAAEMLRLNNSTIARRLSNVENVLGATLFDRRRSGYVATAQGEELIALAQRVELDVVSVARRVFGHGHGHAGDLRITTSDSILQSFLTPLIASFRASNPAIKVEVMVGNGFLSLARGESDIALRITHKPPENLFGRKLATIAWARYAALGGLASSPTEAGEGVGDRQWVSFGGELSGLKAHRFIEERVDKKDIAYRTDSVAAAASAIAAGLGAGFLPCMIGDLRPDLARVGPIEPELDDELWLLTHPDIRKSDRISGFMAHCIEEIGKDRDLIEGLRPMQGGQRGIN